MHGCAHQFLTNFAYQGRDLVYCDPPYLHATRTSKRRYRYDCEEADRHALLALLKTLPCSVILSGYPSALYDDALSGWQSLELQVMNQGGVRTETGVCTIRGIWHFMGTVIRIRFAMWIPMGTIRAPCTSPDSSPRLTIRSQNPVTNVALTFTNTALNTANSLANGSLWVAGPSAMAAAVMLAS